MKSFINLKVSELKRVFLIVLDKLMLTLKEMFHFNFGKHSLSTLHRLHYFQLSGQKSLDKKRLMAWVGAVKKRLNIIITFIPLFQVGMKTKIKAHKIFILRAF